MRRAKTPAQIEAEVLSASKHICNICHEPSKDIQVHHIDGDRSNYSKENLIVLCLQHHSDVTKRSLGKSYTRLELVSYRTEWETLVRLNLWKGYTVGGAEAPEIRLQKKFEKTISQSDRESQSGPDVVGGESSGPKSNNELQSKLRRELHFVHTIGNYLIESKQYPKAVEVFDHILEVDPRNTNFALVNKALALSKLGKAKEAIQELERALASNPKNINSLLLISILLEGEKPLEAIAHLDTILQIDPNNELAVHRLGHANTAAGRYQEAIVCYQRLQELSPNDSIGLWHLGGVYGTHLKDHRKSITYFRQALKIHYDSQTLFDIGLEYHALKLTKKALSFYNKSLEVDPRNVHALTEKAAVLIDYFNKNVEGLEYLDQALKIKPDNTRALWNKSVALTKLRRFYLALQPLEFLQRNEPDASTFVNAAICYSNTGQQQKALKFLTQAFKVGSLRLEQLQFTLFNKNFKRSRGFRRLYKALKSNPSPRTSPLRRLPSRLTQFSSLSTQAVPG